MKNDSQVGMGSENPKRIAAPKWSERIPDRIKWSEWFLQNNPQVYRKFYGLANEYEQRNPGRGISSELIVNVMRFQTRIRATGDVFGISSNAKPLLSRLYLLEYPNAKMECRKSWLDHLAPQEWKQITDAWKSAKNATLTDATDI
jgi:hypothetical protein